MWLESSSKRWITVNVVDCWRKTVPWMRSADRDSAFAEVGSRPCSSNLLAIYGIIKICLEWLTGKKHVSCLPACRQTSAAVGALKSAWSAGRTARCIARDDEEQRRVKSELETHVHQADNWHCCRQRSTWMNTPAGNVGQTSTRLDHTPQV